MPEDIFLSEQHPESMRWAVFEDNGMAGWLYLTEPGRKNIAADWWMYNRIVPPEKLDPALHGKPPPVTKEFAGPDACIAGVGTIKFQWTEDGDGVPLLPTEERLPRHLALALGVLVRHRRVEIRGRATAAVLNSDTGRTRLLVQALTRPSAATW